VLAGRTPRPFRQNIVRRRSAPAGYFVENPIERNVGGGVTILTTLDHLLRSSDHVGINRKQRSRFRSAGITFNFWNIIAVGNDERPVLLFRKAAQENGNSAPWAHPPSMMFPVRVPTPTG
jgi:hypothetical protein